MGLLAFGQLKLQVCLTDMLRGLQQWGLKRLIVCKYLIHVYNKLHIGSILKNIRFVRRIGMSVLSLCRNVVAAAVLVPGLALAAVPEVTPGKDFVGMGYSLSSAGNVIVYAGVREIEGKVAVCGMVWYEKATSSTRAIEAKFTEKMSFKIAGKGLSVGTRSFNRFKTEDEAANGTARCSVTTTAWKPAYGKAKLDMKLGNVTVYD
jgi:hypothetical protein